MYRPPSRPPRGAWAKFLHRERQRRDWSQSQAFEQLREGLGLGVRSRASYVALDMGDRQPHPEEVAFLETFFGASPSDEPEPIAALPADLSAVVAALDRQTAVIADLVAVLRERTLPAVDPEAVRAIEEFARENGSRLPIDDRTRTGQ